MAIAAVTAIVVRNDYTNLTKGNNTMLKSDFFYHLPEELIAQTPIEPRDASRLMVINRRKICGCIAPIPEYTITHDYFYNIADYLNKGDLLVMNDSKVFPARLFAGNCEVVLLERKDDYTWECIGRNLKIGSVLDFGLELTGEILAVVNDGNRLIRFDYTGDFFEILDKIGNMPTPPYITEKLQDNSRYNTIYANETGSAAAPTAGLHFTQRVFERLAQKEIETAFVTLHVGLGTFRPVKTEKIEEHKMHSEVYSLPAETAAKIAACKARGNRVIAVGTTSCRTIEGCKGVATSGSTDIFITPGYEFKVMDSLITNFHLPESTLLMLISAVMGNAENGVEFALKAYKEAIAERYRFFSFGDSMLIL
jgi:S-adenosylmethionine:tRNA ribosyltransferase-isomerase